MHTRLVLRQEESGYTFAFVGEDGAVLLRGLPDAHKESVRRDALHARHVVGDERNFVRHHDDDGGYRLWLKDVDGGVLARSAALPNAAAIATVQRLVKGAFGAELVDETGEDDEPSPRPLPPRTRASVRLSPSARPNARRGLASS